MQACSALRELDRLGTTIAVLSAGAGASSAVITLGSTNGFRSVRKYPARYFQSPTDACVGDPPTKRRRESVLDRDIGRDVWLARANTR